MRAYTHGGVGTPTASRHNIFDSEKLTIFSCAPDGIQTSVLWISIRKLCQLNHPATSVVNDFEQVYDRPDLVCLCVCVCVCVSLASDSSQTVKAITIIKLGTVTPSDMRMHHVLIVLTLTFIQGHTDHNHENNKCSIIF